VPDPSINTRVLVLQHSLSIHIVFITDGPTHKVNVMPKHTISKNSEHSRTYESGKTFLNRLQ